MNIQAVSPLVAGHCISLLVFESKRLPIIDVYMSLSCKHEHSHSRMHSVADMQHTRINVHVRINSYFVVSLLQVRTVALTLVSWHVAKISDAARPARF